MNEFHLHFENLSTVTHRELMSTQCRGYLNCNRRSRKTPTKVLKNQFLSRNPGLKTAVELPHRGTRRLIFILICGSLTQLLNKKRVSSIIVPDRSYSHSIFIPAWSHWNRRATCQTLVRARLLSMLGHIFPINHWRVCRLHAFILQQSYFHILQYQQQDSRFCDSETVFFSGRS